jgi:hypothetical protein
VSTTEAVAILDQRYPKWDLCRLAVGGWRITLDDKDDARGDTIEAAFDAAVAFVPLPYIPRRRVRSAGLDIEHVGRRWFISARPARQRVGGSYVSKRDAELVVAHLLAVADTAATEWESKYPAVVTNGIEGADWRWER